MKQTLTCLRTFATLLCAALAFSCAPKETPSASDATITISPASISLSYGQTVMLSANVNPRADMVLWESLNTNVATVNQAGIVTGGENGTTTIRATALPSFAVATCMVTVHTNWVGSIDPVRSKVTLIVGESLQLEPVVLPDNASNKKINYSSSNTAIASVDENGRIQGIKAGTATITLRAADGHGASTTLPVFVENERVYPTSIDWSANLEVAKGRSFIARVSYLPDNANQLGFSVVSSATNVATVTMLDEERFRIDTRAAGETQITVTASQATGLSKTATLTVHEGEPSVRFNQSAFFTTVWDGAKLNLSPSALTYVGAVVSNLNNTAVTYACEDESLLTLEPLADNRCRVRGKAVGQTRLFVASASSPDVRDTVDVKVWPQADALRNFNGGAKLYIKRGASTNIYIQCLKNGENVARPCADIDMEWDENMPLISDVTVSSVEPYHMNASSQLNGYETKITLTGRAGSGAKEGELLIRDEADWNVFIKIPVLICDYLPSDVKPGDFIQVGGKRQWADGGYRGGDYWESVTVGSSLLSVSNLAVVAYVSSTKLWESDSILESSDMLGYRGGSTTNPVMHGIAISRNEWEAQKWAENNTDLSAEASWPSSIAPATASNHHVADLNEAMLAWNESASAGKRVSVFASLKTFRADHSTYRNSQWLIPSPGIWNLALGSGRVKVVNHSIQTQYGSSSALFPMIPTDETRFWLAAQATGTYAATYAWYGSCPNDLETSTSIQKKDTKFKVRPFVIF